MPWTSFILVTVLFSVICGNRLMDNRLMRLSSGSGPFKSTSDNAELLDTFATFKSGSKATPLQDKYTQSLPCNGDDDHLNYNRAFVNRNCNDNFVATNMKSDGSYDNYNNMDSYGAAESGLNAIAPDTMPISSINDLQIYGNPTNIADIYEVSAMEGEVNDHKLLAGDSWLSSLPVAKYKDFYADLVLDSAKKDLGIKRNGNFIGPSLGSSTNRGCDCKVKNDLIDLGQQHFPRYLLNAVCQAHDGRTDDLGGPKCWSGSMCRPLEYKVKVLTFRTLLDTMQKDPTLAWLPDDLRPIWKFKTVTVTAGCFCS